MRILAVSSQVAYEPVGNSAAVPALQASGHEVIALHTVSLSNHPGPNPPAGFRMPAADLAAMLRKLEDLGVLAQCAAAMTGYFAAADQVLATATQVRRMKAANPGLYVLVDPVMGDNGALYVDRPVAEAIRDELLPLADCISPNRFELEWLTGRTVATIEDAVTAARALGIPEVLATSVPVAGDRLATVGVIGAHSFHFATPLIKSVPHGTGDFLAGLYLARRLSEPPEPSLRYAMALLENAIHRSAGAAALDIAGALHGRERHP